MDLKRLRVSRQPQPSNSAAIGSQFVTLSMQDRFDSPAVIAMGCHSFIWDDLAKAFIEKGARAYIGWSGLVSLDYTDEATVTLIRNLCQMDMTIQEAINRR